MSALAAHIKVSANFAASSLASVYFEAAHLADRQVGLLALSPFVHNAITGTKRIKKKITIQRRSIIASDQIYPEGSNFKN